MFRITWLKLLIWVIETTVWNIQTIHFYKISDSDYKFIKNDSNIIIYVNNGGSHLSYNIYIFYCLTLNLYQFVISCSSVQMHCTLYYFGQILPPPPHCTLMSTMLNVKIRRAQFAHSYARLLSTCRAFYDPSGCEHTRSLKFEKPTIPKFADWFLETLKWKRKEKNKRMKRRILATCSNFQRSSERVLKLIKKLRKILTAFVVAAILTFYIKNRAKRLFIWNLNHWASDN